MPDIERSAREALKTQGFKAPGPILIEKVMDAIARRDEEPPAGTRNRGFDPAELFTDTPELIDRTDGPLTDPGTEASYLLADILNTAMRYLDEEESDS